MHHPALITKTNIARFNACNQQETGSQQQHHAAAIAAAHAAKIRNLSKLMKPITQVFLHHSDGLAQFF